MRRPLVILAYAAALAGGLYAAYRPVFNSGFALVRAEPGDGMLNHYLLEHSWLVLAEPSYAGTFTKPPFYHPEPGVWWYSETLIGTAPVYWALRAVTDYQLAYSWWMIACSALNFVSFAVVARRLGCAHTAAVLGALGFAFLAVLVDQEKHQQLIPRYWMPPALLCAWLLGRAPSARALGGLSACLALQALTCVYTGWFLVAGMATLVPLAAWLTPGGVWKLFTFARRQWRPALLWAAPGVIVMAAFFTPYLQVNRGLTRTYGEAKYLIPNAPAWLTPPIGAAWFETARGVLPEVSFECCLFHGFAATALFVATVAWVGWKRRAPDRPDNWPLAAACLLAGAVWFVLCFRVDEASLWAGVMYVPGAGAIRCVSRVVLLLDLFVLVAGSVWLTHAFAALRAPVRAAVVAALVLLVGAEQVTHTPPVIPRADYYADVDRWADRIRGADAAYLVPAPQLQREFEEVLAMWAGLRANVPVVNGYSGRAPLDFPLVIPAAVGDHNAAVRQWLTGKFHGRVLVIDREDYRRGRVLVFE